MLVFAADVISKQNDTAVSLFLFGIVPPCSVLFTYLCPETRVLDYIWPALFLSQILSDSMPPHGILVSNMSDIFSQEQHIRYIFPCHQNVYSRTFQRIYENGFFSSTGKDLVLDHLDDYLACNLIADFSDNHSLFKCQKFHWQLRMRDRKQCALEVTPPFLSVNKGF